MTSKSLCFKLMREDIKRRVWTVALTVLGLIFTLLVPVAISSSSYMDQVAERLVDRKQLIKNLVSLVGVNGVVIAVLIGLAVVWAVSGFRYLHNSRQVDFYHSIPVKRHQLFLASFLNGILVPMAVYLVIQLLSVALILRTGIGSHELGNVWWRIFLINMVYYSMLYTTMVIAMMMTGNMIIALLGFGVFCGYGPAVVSLFELYKSTWFMTYFETEANLMAWKRAVNYTSPFANYMFSLADFAYDSLGFWRVAGAAAATAALAIIAYGLYRIRPSEAAGRAMAFRRTQSPIKHLIALPVGVVFGMFFHALRSTLSWAVFGVLCGTVLTCCIMEIIYHFDFRKLFANRLHLGACFGISLLLVLAGMYDWYGYDSWLPDGGSVKSAAVIFDYDDNWVTYGDVDMRTMPDGEMQVGWNYGGQADYGFDHMFLTDVYSIMELGKKGVEWGRDLRSDGSLEYWSYTDRYTVMYRLANGKSVYRQYRIPREEMKPLKTVIYDSREYKQGIYPVLEQTSSDTAKVCFQQYNKKTELNLTGEEISHLLAVYQKELEELSMAAREKEIPIATIQFRTRKHQEAVAWEMEQEGYSYKNLEDRCYYPIYPSFVRTLEDLDKAGVRLVKLDKDTVSDIRIQYYWEAEDYSDEAAEDYSGDWEKTWSDDGYEGRTAVYDSEEDIETLLSALVYYDYRDMNGYYDMESPNNADVYVTADFDTEGRFNDRGGRSGFQLNMKKLSAEDIERFGLACYSN